MLKLEATRDKGCCPELSFISTASLVCCLLPNPGSPTAGGGALILTPQMWMASDKGVSQGTWAFVAGTQPQGSSSCLFLSVAAKARREGGQGYQVPGVVAGWVLWVSPSSRWLAGRPGRPCPCPASSVPQAGRTPPCTAQKGQDEDRDRNAWILKIDQQRGFPAGRPEAPFPEWHQLPFCALKCHPIAQGHQSQKEKAERDCLGRWPLGCLPGLSGCPDFNTSERGDKKTALPERRTSARGRDLSCAATAVHPRGAVCPQARPHLVTANEAWQPVELGTACGPSWWPKSPVTNEPESAPSSVTRGDSGAGGRFVKLHLWYSVGPQNKGHKNPVVSSTPP